MVPLFKSKREATKHVLKGGIGGISGGGGNAAGEMILLIEAKRRENC